MAENHESGMLMKTGIQTPDAESVKLSEQLIYLAFARVRTRKALNKALCKITNAPKLSPGRSLTSVKR